MPDPRLATALDVLGRAPRLLVALDFDGVLAPIVAVPSEARPLPAGADAVRALAELPGTIVTLVSGRGLTDLAGVSGLGPPVRMIGSHGAERDGGGELLDPEQVTLKDRLSDALTDLVADAPGVTLEAKPAGVAVHVRNADIDTGLRVLHAVRAGPAAWPGVDATEGKAVLDLAVVQVCKGSAIDVLRAELGADAVLFAGDDVTDETAFVRLRAGDVGIKVGAGDTAADHRVPAPADMVSALEHLLVARKGHRPGRTAVAGDRP